MQEGNDFQRFIELTSDMSAPIAGGKQSHPIS
jgi:hypothetical protein